MTESVPTGCGPERTERVRSDARSRDKAWAAFERRLARAVGRMDVESFLVLALPGDAAGGRGYVQFARWARDGVAVGLRAEAVGSGNLARTRPLAPAQEKRLRRLGWRAPVAGEACQNHWRSWPEPVRTRDVAAVAVATLREVYGVCRPDELHSKYALFGTGATADLGLGLAPLQDRGAPREADQGFAAFEATVVEALAGWFGVKEIQPDDDGDYRVPVDGGAQVWVRFAGGQPPVAAVFSMLTAGIEASPALFQVLNDINRRIRFGRIWWEAGHVTLGIEISGLGLSGEQVAHACVELAHMASVLDDELLGQFGGRMAPGAAPALAN